MSTDLHFDSAKTLAEQPGPLLLAATLYGEARGEPAVGKRAVAWVVRNRLTAARKWREAKGRQHPLFGDGTVAGVVLRPWQFSCWNKGDPNLARLVELVRTDGESAGKAMWAVMRAVADGVLAEPPEWTDPTWGATHYCTVALWGQDNPKAWFGAQEIAEGRTKETVTLGNHVFARVA
jgi:spore germination cell wall hydrolase CwlJ-like protein